MTTRRRGARGGIVVTGDGTEVAVGKRDVGESGGGDGVRGREGGGVL